MNNEEINKKTGKENILKLIPIYEQFMEYMIALLIKLPRTEKYSIGTDFKQMMYLTMENIMYLDKIERSKKLEYLNKVDAQINTQRVMLRIMKKFAWIDIKKFNVAMEKLYEMGKILGGLIKYYAKDYKKSV